MKLSRFLIPAVLGLVCLSSTTRAARADSIGIHFSGGQASNVLAASTSAGVVAQTNWNNLGVTTGTNVALNNNNGIATGTTITYSSGTNGSFSTTATAGDEQLNGGFIARPANTANNFTLNNIAYSTYDIYVYNLSATGTQVQTTLGATSFYGTAPDPRSAGYVDNDPGTAYTYTQATSTTAGTFTPGANYVRFTNLSGATQSFNVTGLSGFGRIGGIQVVNTTVPTPEPSTYAMMALGLVALCVLGAKRKKDGEAI
jgi:hypothetical protein